MTGVLIRDNDVILLVYVISLLVGLFKIQSLVTATVEAQKDGNLPRSGDVNIFCCIYLATMGVATYLLPVGDEFKYILMQIGSTHILVMGGVILVVAGGARHALFLHLVLMGIFYITVGLFTFIAALPNEVVAGPL